MEYGSYEREQCILHLHKECFEYMMGGEGHTPVHDKFQAILSRYCTEFDGKSSYV